MGIRQLSKILEQHAPNSIKSRDIGFYSSQIIAIDASLSIYQFLIAVRSDGFTLNTADGETTSHLIGMFYRTIRMVSSGLTPLYIFDGLPPGLKMAELSRRSDKRQTAIEEYEKAFESGDVEKIAMYDKRKTKVTKKHNDDCKRLLKFMGIPFLDAPSEAEAYCALLSKKKKVFAVATEDMDALTFGSTLLLRNLNAAENKKLPIKEYNLESALKEMEMSMNEFIDMCILLGCDYCSTIKGVGPQKAHSLIKKYGSIENIMENEKKLLYPEDWQFKEAREIFQKLSDANGEDSIGTIGCQDVDVEGILNFLVTEYNFSEERVKKGIERLMTRKKKQTQMRLEMFMKASK